MSGVDIEAKAFLIRKGRLFPKRNAIIGLFVDDQDTGIKVESLPGRKNVKATSKYMVDNAESLLLQSPRYEEFYNRAVAKQRKLPTKGDRVKLAVTIGKFPAGTLGTVVRVDIEDESLKPENHYPVMFMPDGMPNAEIPLAIGEWAK